MGRQGLSEAGWKSTFEGTCTAVLGVLGTPVKHTCLPEAAPHFLSPLRGSLANRLEATPVKGFEGWEAEATEQEKRE